MGKHFPNTKLMAMLILPMLAMLFSGCASSRYSQVEGYPEPDDREGWLARYPEDQYVTAWGVSSVSEREAIHDAKAVVAAAVRSSIDSELLSIMRSESRYGESTDFQRMESRTQIKTHFEHAELIKPVLYTVYKEDGKFNALAVLSRNEAAEALSGPYEKEAIPFRMHAARLDSLTDDLPRFTQVWAKLKESHGELQAPGAEIRAVAGGKTKAMVLDQVLWERALNLRLDVLGGLNIVVEVKPIPDFDEAELRGKIQAAIADLGLGTSVGGCPAGSLVLVVEPRLVWRQVVGKVVQLELPAKISPCGDKIPWTNFSLSDQKIRGEGRRPLEDLMGQIQVKSISENLYTVLKPYLPI